ncbi:uncharacterized protein LOC121896781 [Thunnus maccoyii]|uniref:uncharacterized protein LOC121896781 n=1 Tax=Thunnus maccoyii TaxID=8240 RepID=UPI001C4CEB81|nr:uncharacterized protein LOC121896781 [Thunnus maccoyii]
MWSTPAACMMCILFGIICDVKQVCSQPKLIQRETDQNPDGVTKLKEDIHTVINQIHSLSSENENTRTLGSSFTVESVDLNAYFGVLGNLYGVFQPLMRERFFDDLPKMLVCILSGRQDCGLEAELTKTVSLELGKPLLMFMSSLRSQTCTTQDDGADGESNSFLRAYLRMGESTAATLNGFQQMFLKILSSLPLSGKLMTALSDVVDNAVKYVSAFMATVLQVPMDYIKIALQFGIRIPSLKGKETCEQGDLKQLIMWGIKHNVSWSFGNSIIDILLETFLASEQSLCTYPGPECQSSPSAPFQRSVQEADTDNSHYMLLKCGRRNLAGLNDTLCAEILAGSREGSSTSVLTLCQALSSLSATQMEQVWSNMCYVIQALVSPLVSRSSDCSVGDTKPSPAVTSPSQTLPLPRSAPHRIAREASNLKQLACNYKNWLQDEVVDAVLVSLCSDNEREPFVKQVCHNALLMRKLLSDQMNTWLYGYCANASADPEYMVSQFCVYEEWIDKPSVPVDPSLLEFCMNLDGPRLTTLICEHNRFFMLLLSNPENMRFMPNCSNLVSPPPIPGLDSLMLDSCRYSEWHDVMQITTDVLSKCILRDPRGFTREVCSNKTFLNSLLSKKENSWLGSHCNTSLTSPPTEAPKPFSIADWCDYHTWGERQVDDSVVGLCWQYDKLAFQKNVCCKASVFEKLLQDPQNKWVKSVCADLKEIEEIEVLRQVCKYSDWTRPIIVDMTELALCAEIDPLNFTSKVCSNETVLQNLLANQDNTWLIQHCANYSKPGISPGGGGGQGGGVMGFNPAEQCQYSSWSVSLPDAALLTLCWEHDQTKFVSSICPNPGLLFLLARELSSKWVSTMCATYTNYTSTNNTTAEHNVCLAKKLVRQFNWTCSADFTSACQPGASQNMVLQMMVRCWVESLRSRVGDLLTPPVVTMMEQGVSTTVVILLALEEVQNTSLHVTENIRLSVLSSVARYLEQENDLDKKRVLLQCFGRVLTSLMQTARDVTSDEFFIIKEYFSIPLSSLRSVLSVAHITTVRLILQYYSRNKDTLQLPDNYLSTMVSVLFQTHLVKDGSLFPELAPLLAAASPADIHALPSLQNNTNV